MNTIKLYTLMNTNTTSSSKLYIDRNKVAINYADIICLEGDENYTIIYLSNGKKFLCARTLKDITNNIHSEEFFRVHRSFCINLNHIRNYKRADQEVEMSNGHRIGVARRKKTSFEKQVLDFWNTEQKY